MAILLFLNTASGTGTDMEQSDLTSQVDGNQTSFTVPEYQSGSIRLYFNGVRQVLGESFSEHNSTTITTSFTPQTGDFLTIDYTPA
jgi:hypothetical protein